MFCHAGDTENVSEFGLTSLLTEGLPGAWMSSPAATAAFPLPLFCLSPCLQELKELRVPIQCQLCCSGLHTVPAACED